MCLFVPVTNKNDLMQSERKKTNFVKMHGIDRQLFQILPIVKLVNQICLFYTIF